MPNDYFQFKQFTVLQSRCAMKVGTDGVLLGALCCLPDGAEGRAVRVLDVGTGTGLIAMMVAQRFSNVTVDAIDIDALAVEQARDNVAASPFAERIEVWQCDFCDSTDNRLVGSYDLIISNPPFYKEDTSCPDERRDIARRESSLPFAMLIERSSLLLSGNGFLCVIVPSACVSAFVMQCAMHRLYLQKRIDIKTSPNKSAKRSVLFFCKQSRPSVVSTLLLRCADGSISDDYRSLTCDFYLNM